eukprot:scaffold6352_cov67-Phaeocystis_antarctica.AAC.10
MVSRGGQRDGDAAAMHSLDVHRLGTRGSVAVCRSPPPGPSLSTDLPTYLLTHSPPPGRASCRVRRRPRTALALPCCRAAAAATRRSRRAGSAPPPSLPPRREAGTWGPS